MAAGWPTWLVPVLAVGRALTTHHRPHNCPYKSVALGLFRRWPPPRRVLAAVAALAITASGRYWPRSRRSRQLTAPCLDRPEGWRG